MTARVGNERGGVLVMVALWMPVLLILMTFVVDAGNWFVHKRHLQMQADAGALAGARAFNGCPNNTPITDKAAQYSGDVYNAQIGATPAARVHRLINSKTFYNQPSPSDDTVTGAPCGAGMLDVKLTETDLPLFFKPVASLLGKVGASVSFINAQARVSIFQRDTASGSLPIAVPDVNPRRAKAWFVDESSGAVLGSTDLTRVGVNNGLMIWDNAGAPVAVKVDSANRDIGVVIALGGGTSTTCGQLLVDCYDGGVATTPSSGLPSQGIVHIRGWAAAPSGAQPGDPTLRGATLVNGSCPDPYFSSSATSCTIGVQAKVDFGGLSPQSPQETKLTAVVGSSNYPMTYDSVNKVWNSPTTIPLTPGTGPVGVSLNWEETKGTLTSKGSCTTNNKNPCTGQFANVQRAFSATQDRSGPIQLAQVFENGVQWANSVERCSAVQASCTHNLVVRIGVTPNMQNATSVGDRVTELRVVKDNGGNGSQNQSLNCDPAQSNLRDELVNGCAPTYGVNIGVGCPESPVPTVLHCVPLATGSSIGQLKQGLNARVFGASNSCSTAPNNWPSYPNLPAGDPRIVQLILTPFGSFAGSGNASLPVLGFATFYLTGWDGSPCQNTGDDPVKTKGDVVGHFISYIDTLNPGSGSTPCDPTSLSSCVAAMTR